MNQLKTILKVGDTASPLISWLTGKRAQRQLVTGLADSAKMLALIELAQQADEPVIVVTHNGLSSAQLIEQCETYIASQPALSDLICSSFRAEETLAAEMAIASIDGMIERLNALTHLIERKKGLVFISLSGLLKPLVRPTEWLANQATYKVGDHLESVQEFVEQLEALGYRAQTMVGQPGEYAHRGGIIDVFPLTEANPIRFDFFDVEIDSLRYFDADTQQSIGAVEEVTLYPANEWLYPKDAYAGVATTLQKDLTHALKQLNDEATKQVLSQSIQDVIEQLEAGEKPANIRYYLAYFYKQLGTVIDYFPTNSLVVIDEYSKLVEREAHLKEEESAWLIEKIKEGLIFPEQTFLMNGRQKLLRQSHATVFFSAFQRGLNHLKFDEVITVDYRSMISFFGQMPLLKGELERHQKRQATILISVGDMKQRKQLEQVLNDFEIKAQLADTNQYVPHETQIIICPLAEGFELPSANLVVITEKELFNRKKRAKRQANPKLSNAERLKNYTELKEGDYIVHVNHGIGRYMGIQTLEVSGLKKEYMTIQYADQGSLYVPIDQMHLVQKYVSSESKTPKINKLGGNEWAKTKAKVASKVEDIADDLIALYAEREQAKGYQYPPDSSEQMEFEASFGYVETPDQLRSIQEVKQDMEKERPMDRLLIGDVGYGKTEVAVRAAFKAAVEGKQVAVLVPTTILAEQHYETFKDRLKDYPFDVVQLSRFQTSKQNKQAIEDLKKGRAAIVIGTHRLLSKDVEFFDLGLLIVDEEQRFGVKHKERIKEMKATVDVLTLTATPIPRTLNMSMLGVRDLSVIETPPSNRYPIQTYVLEQDGFVIREGIERELARGGQVFYLYNRVDTIEQKASYLSSLVPEARVGVIHGQMTERTLEDILYQFLEGELDVLVTTTIIETGIDIPNVNTLFIENADRLGLSQLYQLRGRVGRTNRLAYCYLMYAPNKTLTEVGEQRLDTMREFTDLGSGFKIAMRDLAIRGAGNLLGKQQHGFIDAVGYDLYMSLLKEAVDKKSKQKQTASVQEVSFHSKDVEIDLPIEAYLPDHYVRDDYQKIEFYKRIRQIDSEAIYRDIQDDLIDRFGEYPSEASHLVEIGYLRYWSLLAGIELIKGVQHETVMTFNEEATRYLKGPLLFEALQVTKLKARVGSDGNQLTLTLKHTNYPPDLLLEELIKVSRSMYEQINRVTQSGV
ncbi:transcription-repair coupling factor [Atopobacter phocae]|uniref:transcription-repair coupling factor n=1 Tax=Atopobacter phocae TaxID=136492 RepID=UPI000472E6AC|nr:transcription-repair coupling factor [Atopobacter phocae]